MSTRSRIGYQNEDGTVTSIYCHFDGYPSHVGKVLVTDFNTLEQAKELVSLGNVSYLDFGGLDKCCFYSRDRGEDFEDNEPKIRSINGTIDESYTYIYRNGAWYEYESPRDYISLIDLLQGEEGIDYE
jgi:hypothetical protein